MSDLSISPVRTRFAPSPTGSLHIGGARTALYNYLLAKQNGGEFIVRIEDTDQARHDEDAIHTQLNDLHWLGMTWDEGLNAEDLSTLGQHGPYRQSQRLEIYHDHIRRLLDAGEAYYCFMTDAELETAKAAAEENRELRQVQSPYRDLPLDESEARIARGEKATVRCKVHHDGQHNFTFQDLIRGEIHLPSQMLTDFVIVRSDGMPVYNFCCVIDDALMKISHVMRGEEHLSNTLKQLILYKAFGWQPPHFGHLSVILGKDGKKLSKRDGAVSVQGFRDLGFLPEALLNYIALLGWNDGTENEFYDHDDLIKHFALTGLNAASAHFDMQKLSWMNGQYIQRMDLATLWAGIEATLPEWVRERATDSAWREAALTLFRTEWNTLTDAAASFDWLNDEAFSHDEEAHDVLTWSTTRPVVDAWLQQLEVSEADAFTTEDIKSLFNAVKETAGCKGKPLFKALRVAVTGKAEGPELKTLITLLSREQCLTRAKRVRGRCE